MAHAESPTLAGSQVHGLNPQRTPQASALEMPAWAIAAPPDLAVEDGEARKKRKGREQQAPPSAASGSGSGQLALPAPGTHEVKVRDRGLKDMMKVMSKLVLSNSQRVKDFEGILFDVIFMKADSKVVMAMKRAGQSYAAKCKADGKKHANGPPHPHLWIAMLHALVEEDVGQLNKTKLQGYIQETETSTIEAICEQVRLVRVEKPYRADLSRVVLHIVNQESRSLILGCFRQLGGDIKMGRPPRGALETELSKYLDSISDA